MTGLAPISLWMPPARTPIPEYRDDLNRNTAPGNRAPRNSTSEGSVANSAANQLVLVLNHMAEHGIRLRLDGLVDLGPVFRPQEFFG